MTAGERIDGLNVWKDLMPNRGQENLVSLTEVVNIGKDSGMPLSKRALRYYQVQGLIEKPIKMGKYLYYDKGYIFNAAACVLLLKRKFCLPLRRMKKIMSANNSSIDALLGKIQAFLKAYTDKEKKPYYISLEKRFINIIETGDLTFDFKKLEQDIKAGGEEQ